MELTDTCEQRSRPAPLALVAHTDDIVERLEQRLRLVDSPLLAVADARDQLVSQVSSILCAVARRLAALATGGEPTATWPSVDLGAARVSASIHP